MKKQILILTMSLLSLAAQAGHEGPQASPTAPPQVIAEVSISPGLFAPPDRARGESVQIFDDGHVVKVMYYSGRTETKDLATLSPEVSQKLNQLVSSITEGKMLDPNPLSPGCMDGPSTVYTAYPTVGKPVVIGLRQDCKEMKKSNESEADISVARILASLSNLGDLK
jgi:hypothetical protein